MKGRVLSATSPTSSSSKEQSRDEEMVGAAHAPENILAPP